MLARGLMSFKDYNIQANFRGGLDTIASPKRNLAQKANNKKGKRLEQVATSKVIDYPLPKNSRCVVEFNFEKGAPSLKITVLNNE